MSLINDSKTEKVIKEPGTKNKILWEYHRNASRIIHKYTFRWSTKTNVKICFFLIKLPNQSEVVNTVAGEPSEPC